MTATQYLKRKKFLFEWGYWVSVWATISVLALSITTFAHSHHLPLGSEPNETQRFLLETILPSTLFAIFVFWGSRRVHKEFVRNHPEMEHLYQWMQLGESAENYPAEENRLQAEERIPRILLGLALAADTAMQMRDRLTTGRWEDKHEYYRVINDLNERAKMLNRKYISYWTLVIDKMKAIPAPAANPRIFRETNRGSMY